MSDSPARTRAANWTVRILLWIVWSLVWIVLLPWAQTILDVIRGVMVESARQTGNIGTIVPTYGGINAVVMTGMMLLLPAGFVLIAKITRNELYNCGLQ